MCRCGLKLYEHELYGQASRNCIARCIFVWPFVYLHVENYYTFFDVIHDPYITYGFRMSLKVGIIKWRLTRVMFPHKRLKRAILTECSIQKWDIMIPPVGTLVSI